MAHEFASGLKKVFFVVITLLSMATSFLFFVEVFSVGQGLVASTWATVVVNGGIGLLVLDGAAIAWLKIYLQASDNNTLRTFAAIGFVIGFVGSALASFAYLITVASGYNMTPDARIYTQIVMAVIIVAHFALVLLSAYKATSARIDEKTAKLLSEGTEEMLKLTEEYFRDLIPDLAAENALKLSGELKARFTSMSSLTGQAKKKKGKKQQGAVEGERPLGGKAEDAIPQWISAVAGERGIDPREFANLASKGFPVAEPALSANEERLLPGVDEVFPFVAYMPSADGYDWKLFETDDFETAVRDAERIYGRERRTIYVKDKRTGKTVWHSGKPKQNKVVSETGQNGDHPN